MLEAHESLRVDGYGQHVVQVEVDAQWLMHDNRFLVVARDGRLVVALDHLDRGRRHGALESIDDAVPRTQRCLFVDLQVEGVALDGLQFQHKLVFILSVDEIHGDVVPECLDTARSDLEHRVARLYLSASAGEGRVD